MNGPQIFAIVLVSALFGTMAFLMAFTMSRGYLPSPSARRKRLLEQSKIERQTAQDTARLHLATLRNDYVRHWHEFIPYDENPHILLGAFAEYCAICGSRKMHPRPIIISEDTDIDLFLRAGLLHQ